MMTEWLGGRFDGARRAIFILACALTWVLSPIHAEAADPQSGEPAPATISIHAGDTQLVYPTPAGYCMPTQLADQLKNTITSMMTRFNGQMGALLSRCNQDPGQTGEPVAVAVFVVDLKQKLDLTPRQFGDLMAKTIRSESGQKAVNQGIREGEDSMRQGVDPNLQLKASVTVAGVDDYGVYILADESGTVQNIQVQGTIVEAVTYFKGYMEVYLFVAKAGSPADTAAIIAFAKAQTKRLVEANIPPSA